MKLEIKLVFDSEENIRTDYIKDTIEALLYEKEEIDRNNITLYWEKKNIYVCKMKKKNTYKILFGEKND